MYYVVLGITCAYKIHVMRKNEKSENKNLGRKE